MISNTLAPIRIGTFPGDHSSPASTEVLAQFIQLCGTLTRRFGTPFEIHTLKSAGSGVDGCVAWFLGHAIQGAPLLRELPRPAVLEAPWIAAQRIQPGSLIWPSEDTQPLRLSPSGALPDFWTETSALSRASIVRGAELADLRCRENEQPFIAFVTAGYGEMERFAIEATQAALPGREVVNFSIEGIITRLGQPGRVPTVLLTLGRLAIPLGRILSIQAWVARAGTVVDGQRALVQAWGESGAALALAVLMDTLGLMRENEEVAAAIRDELRMGNEKLTERVQRRLEAQ